MHLVEGIFALARSRLNQPFLRDGLRMAKLLLVVMAAVSVMAAGPAPQTFDERTVGGPASGAPAELYPVQGAGPLPAMVLLHPCNGVGPHSRTWARRLAGWGYVTLLVDGFRPRGVQNVCNHGMAVPPDLRVSDAYAAAEYLRSMPSIRADRIGVIGFSHGGWAVLKAVLAASMTQGSNRAFAAAVAFYPGCEPPGSPLVTDTLILIGDADDWTPAPRCMRWRDAVQTNGHLVEMKVYPGALHSFDAALPPHAYAGHRLGRDPVAAADAIEQTRRFLADRLMR
jgi:dienelactone hydrolase